MACCMPSATRFVLADDCPATERRDLDDKTKIEPKPWAFPEVTERTRQEFKGLQSQ